MINISTTELYQLLDTVPADQNIMLAGKHGIGKSQTLTHYFEERGFKVVALFLGQMSDPGDLIGLPNKDPKTGKTEFMPPYWFPMDGQPVVLFLDELNRARPEVLQTIMDLALNRRLAGRSLPAGSRLISAVNDGEEYQLTDLDPALVSRFNIYTFRPSTEEWMLWGSQHRVDSRILEFIAAFPSWLDGNNGKSVQMDSGLEKTPDRRGWTKVSDAIRKIDDLTAFHQKMIAGIVGIKAAAAFCSFAKNNTQLTGKEILQDFDKCKKKLNKYKTHELALVNDAIWRALENAEVSEADAIRNLPLYVQLLSDKGSEPMAHFTSEIEEDIYPKALAFIATKTPKVYKQMLNFIMSL